jgi:radical SAM protein with 4Fe4S-binding SPASM domain
MGFLSSCRTFAQLHKAKKKFDCQKKEHPLTYLFWEATLTCNLECRHCGSRCSPAESRKNDLPGNEVKRIFREIAEDFDTSQITIAVTGGEPLMRDDIFEVMTEAYKLGFFWGMVTNGTLIRKDTIGRMRRAGMDTISVSVDGDAKAHKILRGAADNYKKTIRGLKLLIDKADFLECVQVTTTVHKGNVNILDEMYNKFRDMGVGEWRLLMVDPIGRMKEPENKELLLNGKELDHMLEFVAKKRKSGPMPITFEESGFLGLKYEGRVRDYYFHCPAGINIGSILHDGAISACPSLERNMIEGDGRIERFSEVWRNRFRRYRDRESTRRKGKCQRCKWWKHCEGGSLHLWDWDKEKPRLCHYNMLNRKNAFANNKKI